MHSDAIQCYYKYEEGVEYTNRKTLVIGRYRRNDGSCSTCV